MLDYLFSMVAGFWIGISGLLYVAFYWIEEVWDLPVTRPSESASSSHTRLQQLIQRVIEEALHLPAFLDYSGLLRDAEGRLPEFSPSTYEDLLATAILNKVIGRYQQDLKGASSSGVHSGSSSPEHSHTGATTRRRGPRHQSRDSSPSLEPASHDDYGLSDSSGRADGLVIKEDPHDSSSDDEGQFVNAYSNPVDGALSNINFQNKSRVVFPEYGGDIVEINNGINAGNEEDNDIDQEESNGNLNQNSEIYANNNSWEENWLFQKKKIKTSQSVPVPMLIPNSNTEIRAMIGDRDAEDTTDLSEAGSETEDNTADIKQVLVNSKTIIGGKNPDIVLALIDQDVNDNDVPLLSAFLSDSSPKITVIENTPLIEKVEISYNVTKDENDNQQITKLIDIDADMKEANILPEPITFLAIEKESIESPGDSKVPVNAMRDFLNSLESDEIDGNVEIQEQEIVRSSSIFDQDVFKDDGLNDATNSEVIDKNDELENPESLDGHQQESEYIETITMPVQRHMDSLKRQHDVPIQIYNEEEIEVEDEEPPPPLPTSALPTPVEIKKEEEVILMPMVPVNTAQTSVVNGHYNRAIDHNDIPVEQNSETDEYLERIEIIEKHDNQTIEEPVNENDDIQFVMNGKPFQNDQQGIPKMEDNNEDTPLIDYTENDAPGSIAEREHKKWLNAVPMENNPYSPEAIQRRLSKQNKNSVFDLLTKTPSETEQKEKKVTGIPLQVALSEGQSEFKRYGRDYYINESKKATGARKRLLEMRFDSIPNDTSGNEDMRSNRLTRSTSEAPIPSWIRRKSEDKPEQNENDLEIQESKTLKEEGIFQAEVVQVESVEPQTCVYEATPVTIEDVDTQFDDMYKKAFKFEDDDHEVYALPVDLNNQSTQKLIEITNGIIINNNEILDQSDSISSVDESPRVYNIQSGKVITSHTQKLPKVAADELHTPKLELNGNIENDHSSVRNNIKSWKSTGDVYRDTSENRESERLPESKIESDIDLPSVKDLRKKFFSPKTEEVQFVKPKRKISKDLLDNKIITKALSTSQTSLKQPQHMHSLTARSISKEFRDELKLSMPAQTNTHPGGSKSTPDGVDEPVKEGKSPSRPDSPVPEPGSLRNKLAFFEQLNKN